MIQKLKNKKVYLIVAAFALLGLAFLFSSHAATSKVAIEAESGTPAGAAIKVPLPGASGGNAVAFGGSGGTGSFPAPTDLKAFTGGDSIALVWKPSLNAGTPITTYNVYRDGTKIGTTAANLNAVGTKLGTQYIDKTVTAGQAHSYTVEAVSGGQTSTKTAAVNATRPSLTTPVPTVTLDSSLQQYNSKAYSWYQQYGVDMIKTWYPKMSDKIAFPDYTPATTLVIKSMSQANYDKDNSGTADVDGSSSNGIIISPKASDPLTEFSGDAIFFSSEILTSANILPGWAFNGTAAYAADYVYNRCPTFDCKPITSDNYYTNGGSVAAQFLDWIQSKYDPSYIRKSNVADYKKTYSFSFMQFSDGKNIDQAWGLFRNQTTKTGTFKNKSKGTCMEISNLKIEDNANPLHLASCNSTVQQKITHHTVPNSSSEVLNIVGYCLYSGPANDASSSTFVDINECRVADSGTLAYLWKVNSDGTITSVQGGKCLGATSDSTGNVRLQKCNGTDAQKWTTP